MEQKYIPQRKFHLYHCDHRGLPLALVNAEGKADWSAEYDAWGNVLSEHNPHNLKQLIRLPGQQYDEETGLYYNRHRYYDPLQGRYITQDPIGLKGGWNFYQYPLDPITDIDPLGLFVPLVIGGYYLSAQAVAWISTGLFAAAALSTPAAKKALTDTTSSLGNCKSDPPEDPCDKKLDKSLLSKASIFDPHQVKRDWMGDKAQISRFDLCGCKDGRVVIKAQGCKGTIASSTEFNWK
ncbi:TPA: RHS domain-containing protein [Salmonella enterica subsp. indica]|nr:RHS domain-containing protein [Salmonella enterica subsp. indica]